MRAIWPGALLVVYLSATGVLLLVGRARVHSLGIALHFVMLGTIALATWLPMVPAWVRRFTPLFALLFLYTEMPLLIRAAGNLVPYDAMVMQWEQELFGGQPALEWASRWRSTLLSETLHLAYLSYYPIIFAVPVVLYLGGRHAEFSDAVFALMLTFVVCFLCYIVFPVAGPRYTWPSLTAREPAPVRSFVLWILETRSSEGTAFPSSHVAVAVTQAILAVKYFGRPGAVIPGLTAGLAAGAVYGGFHYLIDVVLGAVLGVVTTAIAFLLIRLASASAAAQANATAPT